MPGIRYKWRSKENCAHIWGFRPPWHLNGRWTFALQSAVFGAGGRAPISPYLGAVGRAAASSWTTASGHLAGQHGAGLGGGFLPQRVAAVGGDDTWWIGTSTNVPVSSWRRSASLQSVATTPGGSAPCRSASLQSVATTTRGSAPLQACQYHLGDPSCMGSSAWEPICTGVHGALVADVSSGVGVNFTQERQAELQAKLL